MLGLNGNNNNNNDPNDPKRPKNQFKLAAIAGAILVAALAMNGGDNGSNPPPVPGAPVDSGNTNQQQGAQSYAIEYTDYQKKLKSGDARRVTKQRNGADEYIYLETFDGNTYVAIAPDDPDFMNDIEEAGVSFTQAPAVRPPGPGLMQLLISIAPMLLIFGLIMWKKKQQMGRGGMGGFGQSKAKLLTEKDGKVTFDDVAGIEEAKEELQEVVDFLKDPSKYSRLGATIPKGVLMVGPPGTGKTLTARAVAGEAGVPFFTISGSDFVEMYVGVGASRVRDMFAQAKKSAPCIVFIDEIDAVGRHRGAGHGGGNDEREQTLNQLLVEMDGFAANEGVILIAATNRPDVLDSALMRPGRFDRKVHIGNPDVDGREKILRVHMRKVPLDRSVSAHVIARGTPGFSGADLANLVNEAALLAARQNKATVSMQDFENAKDKVMMGPERRSMVMTDEERALTAYHEAGHAIVGLNVEDHDPIHKATIIPRGGALGMVMSLPEKDQYSASYIKYTSKIAMAMGGRAAEELQFGKDNITSGAVSDIQQASKIARMMATRFGYAEDLGLVDYAGSDQDAAMGRLPQMSQKTQEAIDAYVRKTIGEGYERALEILGKTHRQEWENLAQALLEYETLTGEEIQKVIRGEKLEDRETVVEDIAHPEKGSGVPTFPKHGGKAPSAKPPATPVDRGPEPPKDVADPEWPDMPPPPKGPSGP